MVLSALQELPVPDLDSNPNANPGLRAALLYRAGKWDEAHTVAQDITGPDGSFWHGILHRQEGDWANAAYWFRKAGPHPIFPALHANALKIVSESKCSSFTLNSQWDPFQFIQWCELAAKRPGSLEEQTVNKIQVAEWKLLYDWCKQ